MNASTASMSHTITNTADAECKQIEYTPFGFVEPDKLRVEPFTKERVLGRAYKIYTSKKKESSDQPGETAYANVTSQFQLKHARNIWCKLTVDAQNDIKKLVTPFDHHTPTSCSLSSRNETVLPFQPEALIALGGAKKKKTSKKPKKTSPKS